MAFISDGQRTWDPERHLELKFLGGLREQVFEISGSQGHVRFESEMSAYHVDQNQWIRGSANQNINTIIRWDVNINFPLPGYGNEETLEILREAFKSYEDFHGLDSKFGHTPREVICRFVGRIR